VTPKTQNLKARLAPTHRRMVNWGIDPVRTLSRARGWRAILAGQHEYERQRVTSAAPEEFPCGHNYFVDQDREEEAGETSGHYFHQDLLVAREVYRRNPRRHVDVGSSIYGFVSHVASFRTIEVLDVRKVTSKVPGITFVQQDLMSLDPAWTGVADSVSCLHALEHFGLGRYGDPVDYAGWRKGLEGLGRLLEPGGTLYLSVPTGERQRVEFNAHRVFSLPFLRDALTEQYEVERLAFVTDAGDLVPEVDPHGREAGRSFGASYGCSIWVLRKA
jgi:SAM-dependent methyltransferase